MPHPDSARHPDNMRLAILTLSLAHEASALVATTLAKPASTSTSFAPPESSVVVGAGPAGLATAIMLSKRGWPNVQVLDRLPAPPSLDDEVWSDTARFYLIGIGGRGREALQAIGSWDAIEPYTAPVRGRKDWAPGAGIDGGVETIRADRPHSNVIQRDRLVACLLAEVRPTPQPTPQLGASARSAARLSARLASHATAQASAHTAAHTAAHLSARLATRFSPRVSPHCSPRRSSHRSPHRSPHRPSGGRRGRWAWWCGTRST